MTYSNERKTHVLLAFQQALLGEITAHVRAVTVTFTDSSIHFDVFVDGPVRDEDREAMSLVETEVMALFPPGNEVSHEIHRLDAPGLVPKDRAWVFHRREH